MNKTKIPSIRFRGFGDAWEQRKFGDLLQTLPFKQFLKEPEPDGKYEIIQQGNEPVIGYANGTPCGDYKDVVIFGDHTLSLYKPQHPFFVATDGVRIVKGQQDTDGYYLLSLLERYKPQSEGYKRYYSILADTNCITTYNTSEQEQIGAFFQQLDNLITLHQRKFEKLTNVKKSMLEKMFPQNGSSYPEIRFKGFTDPWEQRKFEEIAVRSSVICSDANLPRVEYEDIVSGAGRLNKDIYAKESSKSGIAFHQGDVLYGKLRPYLQNWLLPAFDGLAVGDFWVLQPQNADSSFLYRLIQSRQFDEVANQSTGTKMPRADWKLVSKTVFSIPSNICEQAVIGTYFTALDNLITLHQRKGKAAVSGCSNDANNSKGVCCKARDFGYKCHKKDEPNRFDA